jgi:hypothetical protein
MSISARCPGRRNMGMRHWPGLALGTDRGKSDRQWLHQKSLNRWSMARIRRKPKTKRLARQDSEIVAAYCWLPDNRTRAIRGMTMDLDLLILVALAVVVAAVASLVAIQAWRHHSDERRIRKHLGK